MNNRIYLILVVNFVLILSSVKAQESVEGTNFETPVSTVKSFIGALKNKDSDRVIKCFDNKGRSILRRMSNKQIESYVSALNKMFIKRKNYTSIKMGQRHNVTSFVVLEYQVSNKGRGKKTTKIQLKKEGKVWRLDFKAFYDMPNKKIVEKIKSLKEYGVRRINFVKQVTNLFPNAKHYVSTKNPRWTTEVDKIDAQGYLLKMTMKIELNEEKTEIADYSKPKFKLKIFKPNTRSFQKSISFGTDKWKGLVENDGDFSKIGIDLLEKRDAHRSNFSNNNRKSPEKTLNKERRRIFKKGKRIVKPIKEFVSIFPNSTHKVFLGNEIISFKLKAGVNRRYLLYLKVKVALRDGNITNNIKGYSLMVREIKRIKINPNGANELFFVGDGSLYGIKEWQKFIDGDKDFSKLGINIQTANPVKNFRAMFGDISHLFD